MTPKPILFIQFPNYEEIEKIRGALATYLGEDYYILTYVNQNIDSLKIELFSVNNIDEITVKELQDKINKLINK